MRGLARLVWTELLLQLREPYTVFFALVFPPMLVVLFGSIYGNEPRPGSGGFGVIDLAVPGYIAMVLTTVCVFTLPITLVGYRERRILRRLALTPLSPLSLFVAQFAVAACIMLVGTLLLLAVARVGYGLRFAGSLLAAIAAGALGATTLVALGCALAAVVPTARMATVVSMVVFYPMLFLSGMALPREILPDRLERIAVVLPATPLVTLLDAAWRGGAWTAHWTAVAELLAWAIGATTLAALRFRWE